MNNRERDIVYLSEFSEFTGHSHDTIASLLHEKYVSCIHAKNYDEAAHIIARLHFEMVMCMETIAAHLYAYSRRNTTEGILGTLVSYSSKEMHDFLSLLLASKEPIKTLNLPTADQIAQISHNPDGIKNEYTDARLSGLINSTCQLLKDPAIIKAYNRTKHGSVYSRHIKFLAASDAGPEPTSGINFIHQSKVMNRFDVGHIHVTGQLGLAGATHYLTSTSRISARNREFAQFVIICMEHSL